MNEAKKEEIDMMKAWNPCTRNSFVASLNAVYFACPGTPIPSAVLEYRVNRVKQMDVNAPHTIAAEQKQQKRKPAIFFCFEDLDWSWVLVNSRRQLLRVRVATTEYPAIAANLFDSLAMLKAVAEAAAVLLFSCSTTGTGNALRDILEAARWLELIRRCVGINALDFDETIIAKHVAAHTYIYLM